MRVMTTKDYASLSAAAAETVINLVNTKPNCVLTLPSGGTPTGMYRALVESYRQGRVDFSKITLFDLDTYAFLEDDDPRSNYSFLRKHFTGLVNVDPKRWFRLDGAGKNVAKRAAEYEREIASAGGLDLAVIGIGKNGHIAYNEPGSPFQSRTRLVELAGSTRDANARFVDSLSDVPTHGFTMGIGTIMGSRRVVLLASGEGKADIVAEVLEGPVSEKVPASVLRTHEDSLMILDKEAARKVSAQTLSAFGGLTT